MELLDRQPSENARSYALRVLLHNIITLELAPGSAVSENELSLVLKLSRTPVREALIELSKMGLVDIQPQRGSYIAKIDYELVEESGPDHNKRFVVEVHLNSNIIGRGEGRSKKSAEQAAAKVALELMGQ